MKISLPIAIDSMDNATTDAYGRFPNGAVVIARDGTIFAAQKWVDPSGLGKLIDQAVMPTTQPAR